jgi:Arc/MetJ family transcription regulator
MATNLAIDPDLLVRAVQVSGERTKRAAVTKALQEFIARREQRRIADLLGKLEWDNSFDYKAERFAAHPLLQPDRDDHISAAALRNTCRRAGVLSPAAARAKR